MSDDTEEVVPDTSVKLCSNGDGRPAGFGRLGRFCEECRDEQRANKPKRDRSGRNRTASTGPSLEREIKDALMGTASVVAIANQGVFVAIEATVDEFAAAWANVAKQSPTAERYIRAMLVSGVWLTALSASLTMVIAVMVTTGNVPDRAVPLGWYIVGKNPQLLAYVRQAATPPPPPAAAADGQPEA